MLEEERLCLLVLIGVRADGSKVNRPGFGAASCLAKDADHGEEVPG